MARVLIVGCGCRGRELAKALVEDGHAVRGTSRDPARLVEIEAAGAEPLLADPDRLGTLMPALEGVSLACWLMGSAPAPALHGERLRTFAERLVDTHVRGLVYEAAGTAPRELLEQGTAIVREASATWSMPVALVVADPVDHAAWRADARDAVTRVLGG